MNEPAADGSREVFDGGKEMAHSLQEPSDTLASASGKAVHRELTFGKKVNECSDEMNVFISWP